MVLYRKYRPKAFKEVIGQDHITTTLVNSLNAAKVSHAYLFAGPKGTGKTSVARLLAKSVNCLDSKKGEPCHQCRNCLEINSGRSLDIIELDGASNRGVEEIRNLREGIKFGPTTLKYKVFIIDEAHMLTTPAFNALLKTLEEPPSHAIFILATTEPHKILATIASRCQRFDFRKLTFTATVELLKKISQTEKIKIEASILKLLAVMSGGDMRDAYSLLDRLVAIGGMEISLKSAQNILGISDIQAVVKFADLLSKPDIKKALELVGKIALSGVDMNYYIRALIDYFRKMMILKIDSALRQLAAPELTDLEFKTIVKQAAKFSDAELVIVLEALLKACARIKMTPISQLPLEMAVVELCFSKKDKDKQEAV